MKFLLFLSVFSTALYSDDRISDRIRWYVYVPSDAKVTLGGVPTKSTGEFRLFSTVAAAYRKLGPVTIRVEVVRNGKTLELVHTQDISQGESFTLHLDDLSQFSEAIASSSKSTSPSSDGAFSTTTQTGASGSTPAPVDSSASKGTTATVIVRVPEFAEIRIDGTRANSKGTLRKFILNELRPTQAALVDIEVEAIIEGKLLQRSQTIEVKAGDIHNLDFSNLSDEKRSKHQEESRNDDPDAFPEPFSTPEQQPSTKENEPIDSEVLPLPATDLGSSDKSEKDSGAAELPSEQQYPLIVNPVPESCAAFTFQFEKKNLLFIYSAPKNEEKPVLILELLGPKGIACFGDSLSFTASKWVDVKENAEEFLQGDDKIVFFSNGRITHIQNLTKHPTGIESQTISDGNHVFRVHLADLQGKRLGYTIDFSLDGKSSATGPRPRTTPIKWWQNTVGAP